MEEKEKSQAEVLAEIWQKWETVSSKRKFALYLASNIGVSLSYAKSWFYSDYGIPRKYLNNILELSRSYESESSTITELTDKELIYRAQNYAPKNWYLVGALENQASKKRAKNKLIKIRTNLYEQYNNQN